MKFIFKFLIVKTILFICFKYVSTQNRAFDLDLYQNVLDPEKCEEQLIMIRNDALLMGRFLDAGWRVPRSILKGNTRDLGNYFQCLEINENVQNLHIGGKYCAVQFPIDQESFQLWMPENNWQEPPAVDQLPELQWNELILKKSFLTDEIKDEMKRYLKTNYALRHFLGNIEDVNPTRSVDGVSLEMTFELALCIPKVCTTRQALDFMTNNLTSSLSLDEQFCRLPNDKPWVAADTVAVVLLSVIGLITIFSTAYDIRHTHFLYKDPQDANIYYRSFSIYTNTKNFFVFPPNAKVITCLDGIRSLAMMWIILGHTFGTQFSYIPENPLDAFGFMTAFSSLWITSAAISVDTFFMLSGLLVVYTTAAKVSRSALLKNLHLFYLSRFLRMLPVLALSILMLASFLHRTVDGPYFNTMARLVNDCRDQWWISLLYIQNYLNPSHMCVPHTWYLAIDMQLHILSPLVLYWVLGNNKKSAWLAMGTVLVGVLIGASVYNFINNFPSNLLSLSRPLDSVWYSQRYYIHILPRASPFFVGMMFGYLLHLYRDTKPRIPKILVVCFWILAFAGASLVCVFQYWNVQIDWDNQLMDNIINSYKRTIWAIAVGWLIFACHNGYGGPINWLLSLHIFKILGRLSFAMYIFHYPLIILVNATTLAPIYFTVDFSIFRFLTDFALAVITAFLVTITIDFPFTNLFKMVLGSGFGKKHQKEQVS